MAKKEPRIVQPETATNSDIQLAQPSSGPLPTEDQKSAEKAENSSAFLWSGGTWRGKAIAVAEVARDISAGATKAAQKLPPVTPNKLLPDKLRTPSKSTPTIQLSREPKEQQKEENVHSLDIKSEGTGGGEDKPTTKDTAESPTSNSPEHVGDRKLPAAGWGGWWSRTSVSEKRKAENMPAGRNDSKRTRAAEEGKANDHDQAENDDVIRRDAEIGEPPARLEQTDQTKHTQGQPQDPTPARPSQRASWFGLWSPGQASSDEQVSNQKSSVVEPIASNVASDGYSALDPQQVDPDFTPKPEVQQSNSSSSWAFWSKEPTIQKSGDERKANPREETGELAVANTSSERNPKPARMSEPETARSGAATPDQSSGAGTVSSADSIRSTSKPKTKPQILAESKPGMDKNKTAPIPAPTSGDESTKNGEESASTSEDKSLKKLLQKHLQQNLLLPSVHDSLPAEQSQSYIHSLVRIFARRGSSTQAPQKHLTITAHPPKIHKAVAIGVHGYFPTPLVQKVLGQPTGTSLKFANHAAAAIARWTSAHQDSSPVTIEKIALEGEGMISVRLDTLWKLLLNFLHHLRNADLVVLACHSQGVPVSIMLLARLISFGVLPAHTRLAVCGMAGVSLGPFVDYKTRFLGTGSASELFEFSRHDSTVSSQYRSALETCLKHHTRILYVGSIDDQLVSLESALFTTISHPYIYRAVFVDGRIHAPGFITSLVGLACKLRNLGVPDHGLFRELSAPLAGSLYGGEGHSRIYEDEKVYDLGVEFAMETAGLTSATAAAVSRYEPPNAHNTSPYLLPWAMRGVLGEEYVRNELQSEINDLLKLFEEWKPQTKQLKDVKVRLEGLRSKL